MRRRPPRSTRTDTLFPYTTLFRARIGAKPFERPDAALVADDPIQIRLAERRDHRFRRPLDLPSIGVAAIDHLPREAVRREQHARRSEEHTSELQSLMRISYAVFCLKKNNTKTRNPNTTQKK